MTSAHDLRGARVLVLEDDWLQACEAERVLDGAGAEVVGPFSEADTALEAAGRIRPDCALVDVNLGKGPSFAPVRHLIAQNVPVILLTGYHHAAIPEDLAHLPHLEKPAVDRSVVNLIARTLGRN